MSLSFVVGLNLSLEWVPVLERAGWPTVHLAHLGDPRAEDAVVMDWLRENGRVLLSHGLDFATLLALTQATGPSVVQIRGPSILPEQAGPAVVAAIRRCEAELERGALIGVDTARSRVRILPF